MSTETEIVEEYRGLVTSIVSRVRARYDLGTEHEELESFGFAGLLEAHARFDPVRGVKFNTFAYYRVHGAVIDGVRKMAFMPHRVHAILRVAESAGGLLEPGSPGERRHETPQVDLEEKARAIDESLAQLTASFVIASLGQSQEHDAPEDPEALCVKAELGDELARLIDELPERERSLIRGHYFEGRRFDEVAAELGISKSWASRLHAKALRTMRLRFAP